MYELKQQKTESSSTPAGIEKHGMAQLDINGG